MSRTPRRPSLRGEFIRWYSLVLFATLLVFAAVAYLFLRQSVARAGTAGLRQTARIAEQLVVPAGIPRVAVEERRVSPPGAEVEALRRRTRLATGEQVDVFVARSTAEGSAVLRTFLLLSLILVPLATLAAALGGRVLLDRLLRPLDRLVRATREVEIGALARRVEEPERPAELRELAIDFNGMLTRLERAVGALRRFTADASHELRTPLTAIRGTTQVALSRERSAAELRATLEGVAEETDRMLHLVEGLLLLARGEEGAASPAMEAVDLVPLLEEVRELGQALAGEKPLGLRLEAPPSAVVRGAPAALRQVFVNLVSNAVRFTERGSVILTVERAPDGGSPDGWMEVRVVDTGSGIAPEDLPHVFERFFRGDAARGHDGGVGLGLAIARLIVEQHGGTITAASEPGRGSTFRVRLPTADYLSP